MVQPHTCRDYIENERYAIALLPELLTINIGVVNDVDQRKCV